MPDVNQNIDIKNHGIKLIVIFMAAAMAPAILCSGIIFFSMMRSSLSGEFLQTPFENHYSVNGIISSSIALGIATFVVASFHVLILGLPLFLLGLRLRMIRWWTTFLTAFIVGSLPYTSFIIWVPSNIPKAPISSVLREGVIFGYFGLSGGIIFWLLWRYWILGKSSDNFDAND